MLTCVRWLGCWLSLVACSAAWAQSTAPQQQMMDFLAAEARRLDRRFLQGIQTREQWEAIRPLLKRQYLEMLGLWPLPPRTPLHATVTGVLEFDDFVVEKLHFQSMPKLYVTANLYRPRHVKGRLPAVLYLCGHAGRGRDGNKTAYQHHGIWFAKHGYVCLMLDTLQLGEIAAIHHGTYRYNRWWWHALGYTPAGVECWNGIRAIDYLQSRPDVDGERIAVTGRSGGGAATFWVAAADERVKVAVPVSGMSDLEDYVAHRVVNGHCDCMFLVNTYRWPWSYIAALLVPRPLLFLNSGRDRIFPMDGNERIRQRLERLYRLYTDKPEELFDVGTVPGPHRDQPELRLMAYRWINRHLKGSNEPVQEGALPRIEGKKLRVFPEKLPEDQVNTRIDELFVRVPEPKWPETPTAFAEWKRAKLAALRRLVIRDPLHSGAGPEALVAGTVPHEGSFQTEAGITILYRYWPPAAGDHGWIVVADDELARAGKRLPEWVSELRADGSALLIVVPRGVGPLSFEDPAPYYVQRSLPLLGRTLDGTRLLDVAVVADHVVRHPLAVRRWSIAGSGRAGVLAAYVALLKPELASVYLRRPPLSHRNGPYLLNVLRVVDIPAALGLLAPRPLVVVTDKPTAFEVTARLYRVCGAEVRLVAQ